MARIRGKSLTDSGKIRYLGLATPVIPFLVVMVWSVPGCSGTTAHDATYRSVPSHTEGSLITANVTARLLRDPYINGQGIEVRVVDGHVRLNGLVNTKFEAERAEKIAREVTGVISVENNVKIRARR